VRAVSEISRTPVSDIAHASAEQATGLEEVNKALTRMDEVTQQNSVLVDENAATSKTLEQQARAMDDRVAAFRVGAVGAATPPVHDAERPVAAAARGVAAKSQPIVAPTRAPAVAPKPAAAGSNGRGAVGRMRATIATTINARDDWKEF